MLLEMFQLEIGTADLYVDSLVDSEVQTHELRINAPISDTMSLTAGVFMSDLELTEYNLFTYRCLLSVT